MGIFRNIRQSFLFRKARKTGPEHERVLVDRYMKKVYNPQITKPKYRNRKSISDSEQKELEKYVKEVYNPPL